MPDVSEHLAWYVARSSGLVAWGAATASILWGLALSTRLVRRRGVPAWLLDLHRFLGTLTIVAVGVHLVGLWADSYAYFGPREMAVPGASDWRPAAVTWGIFATYFLVAIQITSWLMKHIRRKWWHRVHLTSFAVFVMSTVHGFQSGNEASNTLVQWLALTGFVFVCYLVFFRMLAPRKAQSAARRAATASRPAVQPTA
jgi:predicted ferric reductase